VLVVPTATPITAPTTISGTQRFGLLYINYRNTGNTASRTDDTYITAESNFNVGGYAPYPFLQYRFGASGRANGAFRGRDLRINYTNLDRPPVGFRYASWLIDDRTGRQVRIGPLRSPAPASRVLDDADVGTGPDYTRDGIVAAEVRANADSLGVEWDDFTRYVLLLEYKAGPPPARAPKTEVIAGDVPLSVSSRHPSTGKLYGTVKKAGQALVNATLFLTGQDNDQVLQTTTSDNTGAFRFRAVPVGSFNLNVIPAGDVTVRSTTPVSIGRHKIAGNTPGDSLLVGDSVFVNVAVP
jgi:hypothetical protein